MHLRITDEVFSLFPELIVGVVVARDIRNDVAAGEIRSHLRDAEKRAREAFGPQAITDHPRIACWREAYRAFGAKPKEHRSSIENLVRRVVNGSESPSINPLVDIYNLISLQSVIPAGGEDLDQMQGDVVLARATDHEPPVLLLGEPEARSPKAGEVIYRDDISAVCRRFNWKEADRTKLTAATRNAVLVMEAVPPIAQPEVRKALADLVAMAQSHCGGTYAVELLSKSSPSAVLR